MQPRALIASPRLVTPCRNIVADILMGAVVGRWEGDLIEVQM